MALDSTTQSLTLQTVLVVLGRLAGFVFAVAIPVVLVRALDQEAFATYRQFVLVAGFLLVFLPLGFDSSLFFFIPRDPGRAGNYLIQAVAVSLLLASVMGALLWVFRAQLANALNSPQFVRVTALLTAYLVLDIVGQRLDALVIIEKQAELAAFILAGSDAFKAVAMIVPALLTGSVYWVAVGITVFGLARFLAVAAWAGWRYRGRFAHGVGLVQMRAQAH